MSIRIHHLLFLKQWRLSKTTKVLFICRLASSIHPLHSASSIHPLIYLFIHLLTPRFMHPSALCPFHPSTSLALRFIHPPADTSLSSTHLLYPHFIHLPAWLFASSTHPLNRFIHPSALFSTYPSTCLALRFIHPPADTSLHSSTPRFVHPRVLNPHSILYLRSHSCLTWATMEHHLCLSSANFIKSATFMCDILY